MIYVPASERQKEMVKKGGMMLSNLGSRQLEAPGLGASDADVTQVQVASCSFIVHNAPRQCQHTLKTTNVFPLARPLFLHVRKISNKPFFGWQYYDAMRLTSSCCPLVTNQ